LLWSDLITALQRNRNTTYHVSLANIGGKCGPGRVINHYRITFLSSGFKNFSLAAQSLF
jgi:hypothetical protein